MQDRIISRDKEIKLITDLIRQRENIVVFGQEGVGKTLIIQEVINNFGADRIFYFSQSRTLKEALLSFGFRGIGKQKEFKRLNVLALKKRFYGILAQKPDCIIFDHLGRVGYRYNSFLEYLIEKDIPVIVVCRSLRVEDIGNLLLPQFIFKRVEIVSFDKHDAATLINYFIDEFALRIVDEKKFKNDIFTISQGNPKVIKELCLLAKDTCYGKDAGCDVKLMDLDRRIGRLNQGNEVSHFA